MKIIVITSCTGEKFVESPAGLTLADFQKGAAHVASRENDVRDLMRSAEDIYSGQQHVRLMRGVKAFREAQPTNGSGSTLDLYVLSAGYGLVEGARLLAPYEATFQGMKTKELRGWADSLGVPAAVRRVLAQPYDLAFLLLGDGYLNACDLDSRVKLGGRVIAFCGGRMAGKLPKMDGLTLVPLENADAKRFGCALVGLKGELGGRLLAQLDQLPAPPALIAPATVLHLLGGGGSESPPAAKRPKPRPNPAVDFVIDIPEEWTRRTHRTKLRYFIPDWDDQVDPNFDFEKDEHFGGSGDWTNQTYAHQMFPAPNYDGILISKVVAEKGKEKKERINRLGVHRFLRVPRSFPVMGDCGAFGYIGEKVPPFTTPEILDYYSRLDFDYGVSLDHLIVTATEDDAKFRYDLTLQNAEDFLSEHRARALPWTPIGAVQGWDPKSYADGARKCVAMGYKYIALGGLVRTSTPKILAILDAVQKEVPRSVEMHLFGLARLGALDEFARLGVRSVDSASYLRQAWMRTTTSYVMPERSYAAIRIPEAGKSFRALHMAKREGLTEERVQRMEKDASRSLRAFAARDGSLDVTLNALLEYDQFVTEDRVDMAPHYRRTLENRPWERCGCAICKSAGVEVVVFRGNNRNRRRGFHNTYVFYNLFSELLSAGPGAAARAAQLSLFDEGAAIDAV